MGALYAASAGAVTAMAGVYPGVYRVIRIEDNSAVLEIVTEARVGLSGKVRERGRPMPGDYLQICADGSQYAYRAGSRPIPVRAC